MIGKMFRRMMAVMRKWSWAQNSFRDNLFRRSIRMPLSILKINTKIKNVTIVIIVTLTKNSGNIGTDNNSREQQESNNQKNSGTGKQTGRGNNGGYSLGRGNRRGNFYNQKRPNGENNNNINPNKRK